MFKHVKSRMQEAFTALVKNQTILFIVDLDKDAMWNAYKSTGFLELPNGRRITLDNVNPQKLFNYYIQCLETVNNVRKLSKLREYLKDKTSKVLLVVYDSILVDYAASDGKGTLADIKNILEADGYKVKAKKGVNYDFST